MTKESHPAYAEREAVTIREQYVTGTERWRAGLDFLAERPGERVHYSVLNEVVGCQWRSVFAGWKRSRPDGAQSTRPFHIGEFSDGSCEAWMDEAQAAAVAGAR